MLCRLGLVAAGQIRLVAVAGRTFAAYGGIYVVSSILWLWLVEAARPDRWDIAGAIVILAGSALIMAGPRGA